MTHVWIVVPTYDEAGNVEALVHALRAERLAGGECRTVLIVDDDSPDGTGAIADGLAAGHPDVRVLHRTVKAGLAAAYADGFAVALAAGADVVVQMDADGSHDPADVPRLVGAVRAGADLAIGSRYVPGGATPGWGAGRRLLSRGGGTYARHVLGSAVHDLTGGFKAWRSTTLRSVLADAPAAAGYGFQIELTHRAERAGSTVVELPITFHERVHGASKMSAAIAVEALWRVPALRTSTHGALRTRSARGSTACAPRGA